MATCSNGNTDCRSFKISGSGIGFKGGRYVAETRAVAAKRAGSKLFQKIKSDPAYKRFENMNAIKFILSETTAGSKKKTVAYKVTKERLPQPIQFKRGNTVVKVYFKFNVQKLPNQITPDMNN